MRLLSKPAFSAWCDGSCRAGWSRRPSRTHQAFGCEFQPTHLGKVERNEIRLRRHGPVWDVRLRRRSLGACPRGTSQCLPTGRVGNGLCAVTVSHAPTVRFDWGHVAPLFGTPRAGSSVCLRVACCPDTKGVVGERDGSRIADAKVNACCFLAGHVFRLAFRAAVTYPRRSA